MYEHLPGGEILRNGLKDLQAGVRSVDALLVLVAAPRLTRCGIRIPSTDSCSGLPEHDLFHRLCVEHGPEAYRHYRSLLRRLVSLENALECEAACGRPEANPTSYGSNTTP
jgi:hypothetical protein